MRRCLARRMLVDRRCAIRPAACEAAGFALCRCRLTGCPRTTFRRSRCRAMRSELRPRLCERPSMLMIVRPPSKRHRHVDARRARSAAPSGNRLRATPRGTSGWERRGDEALCFGRNVTNRSDHFGRNDMSYRRDRTPAMHEFRPRRRSHSKPSPSLKEESDRVLRARI